MSNYTLKDYLEGSPAKKKAIEEFYAAQKIAASQEDKLDDFQETKEYKGLQSSYDVIRNSFTVAIPIKVRAYIGVGIADELIVADYEWENGCLAERLEKTKKFKALSKRYKAFVVRVYAVAKKHGLDKDALLEVIVS